MKKGILRVRTSGVGRALVLSIPEMVTEHWSLGGVRNRRPKLGFVDLSEL